MRNTILGLGLALLMAVPGCKWLDHFKNRTPYREPTATTEDVPKVENLLEYLNDNARRVQAVKCEDLAIDGKFDGQAGGLDGLLMFQKPRSLRLKAKLLGQPAVDIGSNDEEFWFWISKADPPYVYHCSYEDLKTKNVWMPFPFQPEMIIAAMGIAEYDPNPAKYELKVLPKTLELIQRDVSADGQKVDRVTVFNRMQSAPGQPQVLEHVLRDLQGNPISTVTIKDVVRDKQTNAILPKRVHLSWPKEKVEMTMRFGGIESVVIPEQTAATAFSRSDLGQLRDFDLARDVPGATGGVSRREPVRRVGNFR